jgi:hypothetical protein
MMEAASTSETSVNFYQTPQCYNPEDSHLHTCRLENLKSSLSNISSTGDYHGYQLETNFIVYWGGPGLIPTVGTNLKVICQYNDNQ